MASNRDHRKPRSKRPAGEARPNAGDGFDRFLDRQFKILRDEIDAHLAAKQTQRGGGKTIAFAQRPRKNWTSGPLKYGIAAAVLVAIVVPSVIQLNRHKEAMVEQTAGATLNQNQEAARVAPATDRLSTKDEREESTGKRKQKKGYFAAKDAKSAIDEDEYADKNAQAPSAKLARKDDQAELITSKREAPVKESSEAARSRDLLAGSAAPDEEKVQPAKPAPRAPMAPSATAAPAAAGKAERAKAEETTASAGEAAPAAPRSIAVDDAKTRLKKQSASDDEKAEMEKLWKEFEKDPKSFSRDKKRSARLKVLLSRHQEKTRAKRLKSAEAELTK